MNPVILWWDPTEEGIHMQAPGTPREHGGFTTSHILVKTAFFSDNGAICAVIVKVLSPAEFSQLEPCTCPPIRWDGKQWMQGCTPRTGGKWFVATPYGYLVPVKKNSTTAITGATR